MVSTLIYISFAFVSVESGFSNLHVFVYLHIFEFVYILYRTRVNLLRSDQIVYRYNYTIGNDSYWKHFFRCNMK